MRRGFLPGGNAALGLRWWRRRLREWPWGPWKPGGNASAPPCSIWICRLGRWDAVLPLKITLSKILVQLVTFHVKIEAMSEHVGTPSARVRETFSTQPENHTLCAADAVPDDDEDEQAWNGLGMVRQIGWRLRWPRDVGSIQTINMYHCTLEYIWIVIFPCMSSQNDWDGLEQD